MKTQNVTLQYACSLCTWTDIAKLVMVLTAAALFAPVPVFSATTEFSGGTLSALTALSPTLTFDELVISGPLSLPTLATVVLHVNKLTVSASGSVGYSYTPCQYEQAPSFGVEASGQVIVNGPIDLSGRWGTRSLDTATCNQCFGCDGGNVRIIAQNVTLTAAINTSGGGGSTSVSTYGSSGCSGGAAGSIELEATNQIVLDGASLTSNGGKGGTGYISGVENYGADGASAEIQLVSHGQIQMARSTVTCSGSVILQAQQAAIWGPIYTGQLLESINGQKDTSAPTLDILAPRSGEAISLDAPLQIRVATQDSGAGIKEVKVTGLGHDQVHSGAEIEEGVLTVALPAASWPFRLEVTVTDNKGHQTTGVASNLPPQGNWLVPSPSTSMIF